MKLFITLGLLIVALATAAMGVTLITTVTPVEKEVTSTEGGPFKLKCIVSLAVGLGVS